MVDYYTTHNEVEFNMNDITSDESIRDLNRHIRISTKHFRNSTSSWKQTQYKLESLIRNVGIPQMWFTCSLADNYDPHLSRILNIPTNCSFDDRCSILSENAFIVNRWMDKKFTTLRKRLEKVYDMEILFWRYEWQKR